MLIDNRSLVLRAIARGAIIVAAVAGSAAFAQPHDQIDVSGQSGTDTVTRSRAVRVSDLNLTDQRGRTRLDYRLQSASARVCDGFGSTWIKPPKSYSRCYDSALDAARAEVSQRLASGSSADIRVASR